MLYLPALCNDIAQSGPLPPFFSPPLAPPFSGCPLSKPGDKGAPIDTHRDGEPCPHSLLTGV